ncbi:MAG: hypothetical protein NE334_02510 [Lentisphaeraceae bacterium]|nr:hypothetical protein [Lentisphaeraceae bacterium]
MTLFEETFDTAPTEKKTPTSKEKAIKAYNSYLNGTLESNKKKPFPSFKFVIQAKILVEETIRGSYNKGDVINFEWEDLYDSMCPHPTTSALNLKPFIWYNLHDHSDKKTQLSVLPVEKKVQLLEAFEINKKNKEEALRKHKKKVKLLLKSLDQVLDEDQVMENLFELSEFDDKIIEEKVIKKLSKFKGSNYLLDEYIYCLSSILVRKEKTNLTNLSLPKEIKAKLKKEIELQKKEF